VKDKSKLKRKEELPFTKAFYGLLDRGLTKIHLDYGFIANPFHSVWKNVILQLRRVPKPAHELLISNLACHNLCFENHVRTSDLKLIGLGLNYCVTSSPPKAPDFSRFNHSVRIRHHFAGDESSDYNRKLYIPAPEWMPPPASPSIEAALKTFEARINRLHKATQNPHNNTPNLSASQLKRLEELKNDPLRIIIPTDKNLGPAIMDRSGYIQHCLKDHLLNATNYKQLDKGEAHRITYNARADLQRLTIADKSGIFPPGSPPYTYFYRSLKVRGRRKPQFYIMPKVHKLPMKTRPVISCIGSTMEIASKWLDNQLQRVVHLCPCYLRDSWQLIEELKGLGPLPADAKLITADAVSMYSNIHTDHGVRSVRAWLIRHSHDDEFPTDLRPLTVIDKICELLKLVMTTNVFDLDDTTWLQLTGTAMGTSAACVYATIYYSEHEELAILNTEHNDLGIIFYRRFIDDAFIVQLSRGRPDRYNLLQQTMNSFGEDGHRLEWTSEPPSMQVDFLDLTILIGNDRRICTKTFQKEMNLFLYIPPISSHSPSVLNGLIFGQLRRFWLQNTLTSDFIRCAHAFYNHLLARGHDSVNIQRLFLLAAARLDHPMTLTPAKRLDATTERPVFLHVEYHPRQIERLEIQKVYGELCAGTFRETTNKENISTGIGRLIIAYSRPPNFRDLLCRTKMVQAENERVSDHIYRPPG
jgi:hypothetical protein